ncbi:formaldehyde-activating enzyme [Candidatus Thiodictyon syntrophicum]|jgi:formaldehyde-activating enzyme|uniref:Formaldehyde-activating enzyme n=1 Tax=Candidatus Thiodictyon syntrophicum TaxID=1166950 RepID=A0A2K8UJL4_9GAMM|nr:formaldehyde-activating enzyme [Candidatus Thiodictyon syntrophicum]AUB85669.1 formaldehyde-activating enzyme [Candidatus Thiodictyon syntrophicum]
MSSKIIFKAGEATVFTEGKDVTAAMPEILIGAVDGPVGHAFANMMAQSKGHTAMFAVRDINQLVRPATIMVPKVTLKHTAQVELFGGLVQSATADAVLDCVIEGIIPRDQANDLCIITLVWIDPGCAALAKKGKLDKADMYKNNYEATKLAIQRALNDEPSIDELIKNRHTVKHCMWEESWNQQ